jgi:hypothetical protein
MKSKQQLAEEIDTLSQRIGMLSGALVTGCDAQFWFEIKRGIVRDVGLLNYELDVILTKATNDRLL